MMDQSPSDPGNALRPVALYARVSTEDQAERQTVQGQLDFLREFCRLYNLVMADAYVDDGWSGAIALAAWCKDLATMGASDSLWPSAGSERGVTSGTFYGNLRRYLKRAGLPLSGVHIFRHSAAKLRRDAGESIEDVSRFLDHSSLAVTTSYLRRLEGQEDRAWAQVAAAISL